MRSSDWSSDVCSSDLYESGKIHEALSGDKVRSKSEVIIANLLHQAGIPFTYEEPLYAEDGSFFLPDFTLRVGGEKYLWEHWGMMSDEGYSAHRQKKKAWYENNFPGRLLETLACSQISSDANRQYQEIQPQKTLAKTMACRHT